MWAETREERLEPKSGKPVSSFLLLFSDYTRKRGWWFQDLELVAGEREIDFLPLCLVESSRLLLKALPSLPLFFHHSLCLGFSSAPSWFSSSKCILLYPGLQSCSPLDLAPSTARRGEIIYEEAQRSDSKREGAVYFILFLLKGTALSSLPRIHSREFRQLVGGQGEGKRYLLDKALPASSPCVRGRRNFVEREAAKSGHSSALRLQAHFPQGTFL